MLNTLTPRTRDIAMITPLANIAGPDLLIILAIVVLLFGSTQLPKLARSLGQASKEFRKGADQGANEEPDRDKD
jgi:sec-independent protein translocase protein TatA